MSWIGYGVRAAVALLAASGLAACQSTQSSFQGSNFSGETRALEKQLDAEAVAGHAVCASLAQAFQSDETVALIERETGAKLDGCFLRLEYAQDTEGFWLRPHTDLGVKKFTMLYYLGPQGREDWGTDIYADADTWAQRAPFTPGHALVFVPSDNTWHGFEARRLDGVRKSLIINYVTDEWRAREQLAYPDRPVRGRP